MLVDKIVVVEADYHQDWKPRYNPWLVALVVTLATFMEVLDSTIVNVSLPHIAGDLSTTNDNATWTLTSYLAANAIVLTVSGWLSRQLGRKRYFLICIGMFTLLSFMCGIAGSLTELVIFRLLQGLFGGGLQPVQQAIILDIFPPEKRGAAFGMTAVAIIVAPILGPTLGGIITEHTTWRWIFFINVPVGLFAIFAIAILVDTPPWEKITREKVDFVGLSFITLGLGCLEIMVDRGEVDDWFGSPFIQLMACLTCVGLVSAVVWLLHARNPIVHLAVFRDRNFAISTLLMAVMGFILYSSSVLTPLFAQQIIGYTALWSGLVLSPGGLTVVLLLPLCGYLLKRLQTRYLIALGLAILGCMFVSTARLTPAIDFYHMVVFRIFQAAGLAFIFVPISTIAFSTIPRHLNADASALLSMTRNVFGAIGISVSTSMVAEGRQTHQTYLSYYMTSFHQPFNDYLARAREIARGLGVSADKIEETARHIIYADFMKQAAVLAYNDMFVVLGIVALCAVPLCFFLKPSVSGKGL